MSDNPSIPEFPSSADQPASVSLPPPVEFDPGRTELPVRLMPDASYPGPILLLLQAADDLAWAADAAVEIAARWARAGRRIVLADLHLEEPVLHERLDEPNHEGMADIFLYGASVARSARLPRGHKFYLITAGTYTATPEEVYRHERWSRLVAGFRDAQATLLLFAPERSRGIEALAEWSGGVVLLRSPAEEAASPLPGVEVLAVLTRPGAAARPAASVPPDAAVAGHAVAAPPAEERPPQEQAAATAGPPAVAAAGPGGDEGEEAWMPAGGPEPADAWHGADPDVQPVPVPDDVAPEAPEPAESPAGVPAAMPPRRRRRTGPGPLIWLLAIALLLIGLVVFAAMLRPELFGGTSARGAAEAPTDTLDMAAPVPAPPTPLGDTLTYTVQLRAYAALDPARGDAERQQRRLPEVPFYIVPEPTQGVLYYKVMAGLLPDTVAAAELRRRLIDERVIEPDARGAASSAWSPIQARPLAFELGEFATVDEARARADSLATLGIPGYAVPLPYSDGSERWRLYGGAFADSASAEEMQRMLEAAELPARLVVRVGGVPVAAP